MTKALLIPEKYHRLAAAVFIWKNSSTQLCEFATGSARKNVLPLTFESRLLRASLI